MRSLPLHYLFQICQLLCSDHMFFPHGDFFFFYHFLYLLSTSRVNLSLPPPASHSCHLPSPLSSLLHPPSFPFRSSPSPLPGRSGLAASYLSVKALVPQMPKLLKSLFPAREDKKELRPSPNSQQVRRRGSKTPQFFSHLYLL